jgi:beta-lactamase regulating signal transducer with metallopeptidase domain
MNYRLDQVAIDWADAIVRASWQGAIAAAFVFLICFAWRRMPPTLRCALWWLVCLKLVLGLAPAILAVPVRHADVPHQAYAIGVEPASTESVGNKLTLASMPEAVPPVALVPVCYLFGLWFGGAILVGAISLRPLVRARRFAKRARPSEDAWLIEEANRIGFAMGLRARLRIVVIDVPNTVLTVGAWRPTILISQDVLQNSTKEEVRMILSHEIAHQIRFDAWIGILPQIVQIAFFFHPAAWIACREFDLARETACDQAAVTTLHFRPDLYGALLLRLGVDQRGSLCAPGVSSHFRLLHRRITMLENLTLEGMSRPRRRSIELVCVALTLCVALISPVEGQSQAQPVPNLSAPKVGANAVPTRMAKSVKHAALLAKLKSKRSARNGKTIVAVTQRTKLERQVRNKNTRLAGNFKSDATIAPDGAGINRRMAEAAEVQPDESLQTHVVPLHYARVSEISKILRDAFGPPSKTLRISYDQTINDLIISASPEKFITINNVLRDLDIPRPEQELHSSVFRLRYANAVDLAPIIDRALRQPGAAQSDPRINAIILTTTDDDTNQVSRLLSQLDTPSK